MEHMCDDLHMRNVVHKQSELPYKNQRPNIIRNFQIHWEIGIFFILLTKGLILPKTFGLRGGETLPLFFRYQNI